MNELTQALDLWIELTGVDPNATSWTSKKWEICDINEEIKESVILDPTNVTTMIMLEYFVAQYLNERTFAVNEVLSHYAAFLGYLEKCKKLYSLLQTEQLQELKTEYQASTLAALEHYGVDRDDVREMVMDSHALAFLRRDALRSMESLSVHQFLQGAPDPEPPKYHKQVYCWWNINSLLRAVATSPRSGISLNLIRDPVATSSYFAFVARNGGTVTILTDKPSYAHPRQKYMSRRPGKAMSKRIARHHFPYDLMELEFDYRGDAYAAHKNRSALVQYQVETQSMKAIAELEPDEVIWIIMMFSQIQERFWKEGYRTEELSYTGEMLEVTDALIANCTDMVAVDAYRRIEAPPLTSQDVTTDRMAGDWKRTPTQINRWMEEKYADQVRDEYLNLAGDGAGGSTRLVALTGENAVKTSAELIALSSWERKGVSTMTVRDTTNFGTARDIIAEQRYVARYNHAVMIRDAAIKEFEERRSEVSRWYRQTLNQNLPNLLQSVALGEFIAPTLVSRYDHPFDDERHCEPHNILVIGLENDHGWSARESDGVAFVRETGRLRCNCFLSDAPATVIARFRPTTAEALAALCAVDITALPDVLQHWTESDPYIGNPILDKLDPLEWVVTNPWRRIHWNVTIYLSKSAYNQLRKEHRLPPNKFWLAEAESAVAAR